MAYRFGLLKRFVELGQTALAVFEIDGPFLGVFADLVERARHRVQQSGRLKQLVEI